MSVVKFLKNIVEKEGNLVICDDSRYIMLSEISQIEKDKYYMISLNRWNL